MLKLPFFLASLKVTGKPAPWGRCFFSPFVVFFGDPELIIWTSVHGILAMASICWSKSICQGNFDISGPNAHANIPCKIVNPYDGFEKILGISIQQQRLPCFSPLIYTNWNTASCLVGGWTNPSERYARQIGSFPQGSGWNLKKKHENTCLITNHSSFSNPVIQDGLNFWGEPWHLGGTFKFPWVWFKRNLVLANFRVSFRVCIVYIYIIHNLTWICRKQGVHGTQ